MAETYSLMNRIITRVSLRARVVVGQLHPDDVQALKLLGFVAGYVDIDPRATWTEA